VVDMESDAPAAEELNNAFGEIASGVEPKTDVFRVIGHEEACA
jgi:hypothetical protein